MTTSKTAEVLVHFDKVQKSYDGETLIIKNLILEIKKGEFMTMLGPSGSGKTTVLMMLAGFEAPTRGDILLNGQPINSMPPHKRGLGMVFQNYALFPHMTVGENLAFPLQVRKLSKSEVEEKVKKTLDMVKLPQMADRRPAQLSGGQQQRIAVARALVFEPELVLMDEPLGALDKNLREEMQYEIKHIHENTGISVVYVTHDQTEALTMSCRIAVFNSGIIQQLASPDKLYEEPQNAFVAGFIGENNKLYGKVTAINDNLCTVELDHTGDIIQALKINVSSVGERTCVSLRPERVMVEPNAQEVEDILEAKILELIYHGDHIRGRLDVAGCKDFIIKIPNAKKIADLTIGKVLKIGWVASDCRALDTDQSE